MADKDRDQAGDVIPAHVRRFILLSVPSVPHLEALLLLRENATHHWTVQQLASRLYMKQEAVTRLLDELEDQGLVAIDAAPADAADGQAARRYIFRPATEELRQMLAELAHCYVRNLRLVTHLIHSRPGSQAQQFADAFRLGKES